MCCGQERTWGFWTLRAIFVPLAIAGGVFLFGTAVMLLWNALLPAVLGVSTITFWQAVGILILSKILFGGFRGGHHHHRPRFSRHDWNQKWMHLSPEEREKMRAEWRNRCGSPTKTE